MSAFTAAADLGQVSDYSAVAVIERVATQQAGETAYHIRHLERLPLGMPYTQQVERLSELMSRIEGAPLVVDRTGIGAAVIDMLRAAKLAPVPVTITAGSVVTRDEYGFKVPKRDLVAVTQVLLENGRLKIAADLEHAQLLIDELLSFKVNISASGRDTYGNDVGLWREAPNDDLVLAVALACWRAEQGKVKRPPVRSYSSQSLTGVFSDRLANTRYTFGRRSGGK